MIVRSVHFSEYEWLGTYKDLEVGKIYILSFGKHVPDVFFYVWGIEEINSAIYIHVRELDTPLFLKQLEEVKPNSSLKNPSLQDLASLMCKEPFKDKLPFKNNKVETQSVHNTCFKCAYYAKEIV